MNDIENDIKEIKETEENKDINVDDVETPSKAAQSEGKIQQRHAPTLTKKEIYSLKTHKYENATKKYKTSYVILNKKTGLIVEMKAASAVHACSMIGWKSKNCKLIKETIHEDSPEKNEVSK